MDRRFAKNEVGGVNAIAYTACVQKGTMTIMPIHDWSRVKPGIFHDFHHAWIEEIKRGLNRVLPSDYYALAEQRTGDYGPDVLTLQSQEPNEESPSSQPGDGGLLVAPPKVRFTDHADLDYYSAKQKTVVIRHASDDEVIAMVEVVSPGNKSSQRAFRAFCDKVYAVLDQKIHLMLLDVNQPTSHDPKGLHATLWHDLTSHVFEPPEGQLLTLASYQWAGTVNAYVEPTAVGLELVDMPLYLDTTGYVNVPLIESYANAFEALPRRWQTVVAGD